MAVALVQTKGQDAKAATSVSFTPTALPTVGSILLAFCSYSQFAAVRTIAAPDGTWTKVDDVTNSNNDSLAVFWHPVVATVPASYVFPVSGASGDNTAGTLYEISGASTTAPINQHATTVAIVQGTTTTATTASVTPSVLNTMAFASVTHDNNTVGVGTVSAGWNKDFEGIATYHTSIGAHKTALTSDTTTAISNTFTNPDSVPTDTGATAIVLIAPPAAGGTTVRNLASLGVGI